MISTIFGGIASDDRGDIRFVNDFNMSSVKRFYIIKNSDTKLIRGWRGHRIEQRWFYILKGAFEIDLVKVDDWSYPNVNSPIKKFILEDVEFKLLHVPKGYATAFRAIVEDSELMVFADYDISHSKLDDYTWPLDYFLNK